MTLQNRFQYIAIIEESDLMDCSKLSSDQDFPFAKFQRNKKEALNVRWIVGEDTFV